MDNVDAVDGYRPSRIQFGALGPLPDQLLTHHVTFRGAEPLQLPKAERPLPAVIDAKTYCPGLVVTGAASSTNECSGMTVGKPSDVVHLAAWIMDTSHD